MKTMITICAIFLGFLLFAQIAQAKVVEFTVIKDDNFTSLSKKYHVDHAKLIKMNRDRLRSGNPNLIFPGEKFVVEISDKVENATKSVSTKIETQKSNPSPVSSTLDDSTAMEVESIVKYIEGVPGHKSKLLVSGAGERSMQIQDRSKRMAIIFTLIFTLIFLFSMTCLPMTCLKRREVKTPGEVETPNEEEKEVIGKSESGMYHILTRAGGINGSLKEVSEFIVSSYGRSYLNHLGFVKAPLKDDIFGEINQLGLEERTQLDRYIRMRTAKKQPVLDFLNKKMAYFGQNIFQKHRCRIHTSVQFRKAA